MKMREFFEAVWPPDGIYCVATPFVIPGTTKETYAHRTFDTIADVISFAKSKRDSTDLFFAVHTLDAAKVWDPNKTNHKTGTQGAWTVRTHANMKEARAFFFDLDVGSEPHKYATREAALSDLERFLFLTGLPDPLVTSSGGGFHVYWRVADAIPSLEWKKTAARLHALARHFGMRHDVMRTTDQSSVLRIVGTFNLKAQGKRPVVVVHPGVETGNAAFLSKIRSLSAMHNIADTAIPPRATAAEPVPLHASNVPDNTTIPYSGPVTTFKELYETCGHVRNYIQARGRVSEPSWYTSIGLIQFVRNGHRAVHKFSRGHPGYSAGSTDAKLAQYNSRSDGPPSCATLDAKCGGNVCAVCPGKGRGANPLIIAQKAKQAIPAPAPVLSLAASQTLPTPVLIDPDPPYKRVTVGIMHTKFVANPTPGMPKLQIDTIIARYDMFPIADFKRTKLEGAFSLWAATVPIEGQTIFKLPATTIHDQRALTAALSDEGVHIDPKHIPEVRNFMVAYIRKLQAHQRANQQHDHLGWTQNYEKFVTPSMTYGVDGSEDRSVLSNLARPAEQWVSQRGTLAGQIAAMSFYNSDEYLASQFAILCALGSLIFYATELGGAIVSLAGESGTTKSTTLYAAGSCYGPPTKYVLDATPSGSTINARNERIITLANYPVLMDEITNMTPEEAKDFALHASQFTDRGRLTSTSEQRATRSEHKSMITIVSTNMSLYQLLSIDNAAGIAGSMRVFEIAMPPVNKANKPIADQFLAKINENYGWIGPTFLKGIIQFMPTVVQAVRDYRAKFDLKHGIEGSERFFSGVIAPAMVAGRIAVGNGLLPFDLKKIDQWLVNSQLPHMRRSITEEVEALDPIAVLSNYLEYINGETIKVHHDTSGGNIPYTDQAPMRELKAHLEIEKGWIYVRKDAFRDFCNRKGRNPLTVINTLAAAGIIPRPTIKYVLGRETIHAKSRTTCFAVNLHHTALAGVAIPVVAQTANVVPIGKKKGAPAGTPSASAGKDTGP